MMPDIEAYNGITVFGLLALVSFTTLAVTFRGIIVSITSKITGLDRRDSKPRSDAIAMIANALDNLAVAMNVKDKISCIESDIKSMKEDISIIRNELSAIREKTQDNSESIARFDGL